MSIARHRPHHIVITAGPTREYLDSVRYLSNPSTGKMGYAIAKAAVSRGHRVTLISGPVAVKPPPGVRIIDVITGNEMAQAAAKAFEEADAAVFAAAVCDYRPAKRSARKLPKSKTGVTLQLIPTQDIAASLGRIKGGRVTVAFALEDHNGRQKAEQKLICKHADAILLNSPAVIGSERTQVEFLKCGAEWETWGTATKSQVALRLIREIERLILLRQVEAPSTTGAFKTGNAKSRPRRKI